MLKYVVNQTEKHLQMPDCQVRSQNDVLLVQTVFHTRCQTSNIANNYGL